MLRWHASLRLVQSTGVTGMLKQFDEFGRDLAEILEESALTGRVLLCAACRCVLCREPRRLIRYGAHRHHCVNPLGVAFEIGCFDGAANCRGIGVATTRDSWFSGYAWRIQACAACDAHLGWLFTRADDAFLGLIVTAIIESGDSGRADERVTAPRPL